jgi:hypothetical protein
MNADNINVIVNDRSISLANLFANPGAATYVVVDNCPGLTALPRSAFTTPKPETDHEHS